MIPKTKIIPPPLRPRSVRRPHLYSRLDRVLERRLAIIVAPAGYGKSSLARAWIERLPAHAGPLSIAWLSLDPGDDDADRFIAGLIAALRASAPPELDGLGSAVLSMLERGQRLPHAALVTSLVNELQSTSRQFVVILDDYHVLQSKALHESLNLILKQLPAHVHLVITSRCDPPLPLWRLRAAGELVELRAADLRFSAEETATFFNTVMGFALPAEAITILDNQLEGWVAGLQLAALAGGGGDGNARWTSEKRTGSAAAVQQKHIFDYLAHEVLARQSPDVRRFLLATSVVERFSSALGSALLGDTGGAAANSQRLLQRLIGDNLFVVPLDEEGHWFRYHHLFHAFLREELARRQKIGGAGHANFPPDSVTLHARACRWFGENGHWDEAIHHALAAGDVDGAAALVGQAIRGLFRRGKLAAIRHYLELLPEEAILSRHNYCVGYAWVLALGGELQRVEKYLQAAEKQLAVLADDVDLPFDVNYQRSNLNLIRATVAQRHGDVATTAHLSSRALDTLEEKKAPALCSIAAFTLGEAYAMSGQLREAQQTLQRAAVYAETAGHRYLACSALSALAGLRRRQGRLQEAEALYRRILEKVAGADTEEPAIAGSAFAGLGALAYEWNRLPEARELAQRAVALHQVSGEATGLVGANLLLAQVHVAQGEINEGHNTVQVALSLAQRWQLPAELAWSNAWRARYVLRAGNGQAALALARQAAVELETAAAGSPAYSALRGFVELTLVRAYLSRGSAGVEAAASLLKKWQVFAQAQGLTAVRLETTLLEARAQHLSGNAKRARHKLLQALMLAQPEGFTRLFVDEGAVVAALLREVVASDAVAGYVQRLIGSFDNAGAEEAAAALPQEALTSRQQQILTLMARGLSNREIAEQLVISPETVRWHTKQIYRRLDVRNRTEAAAYARRFYTPAF